MSTSPLVNTLMIADDDLYIRQLVRKIIGALAEVVEVEDGAQVIETYTRVRPHMLLLDIHLPHAHGPALIAPLIAAHPQAFIIMLSADAVRDNIMACLRAGAQGFIAKPFSRSTLLRDFHRCPHISFSDSSAA